MTFGFANHGSSGFLPADPSNDYYASAAIFPDVFVDNTVDSNLADGDGTDYHIDTGDTTYAYNQGMDTGSSTYGSVTVDIDGQSRPRSGTYDRGADER